MVESTRPANTFSSFILPNEYERKIAEAKRREAMAKMLAQQQYQPLEGSAAPTPSYAPLVQGLQSYLLARELKKGQEAKDAATELEGQSARQISGRLQGGRVSEPTLTGMESQPIKDFYQMRKQMAEPILQEEYQRIEAEKNAPMPKNPTVDDLQPVIPTAQYTRSPRDALGVASTAVGQAALKDRPFLNLQLAEALKPVTKEFTGTPFIDDKGNAIIIDKNTGLPTALKNPDGTPMKGLPKEKKPSGTPFAAVQNGIPGMFVHDPEGNIVPVPGLTPYRTPPSGGDSTPLSSEDLDFMARQALSGDPSVFSGLGSGRNGAQNRARLRNKMTEVAKELNISPEQLSAINAQYFGTRAGERTLGTRTANIGLAISEAKQLMPLAIQASELVKRTDFPLLNKIIIAGEKNIGDENVVRFGIATNSLINAYARAINPTGISTVSDKEHARKLLETAWSKGQFSAAVDQLNKEMQAAKEAPNMVREEFRNAITGEKSFVVEYVRDPKTNKMVKK